MSEQLSGTHEQLIRAHRPEASNITPLGAGDFNGVYLVDGEETFRIPLSETGRQSLLFEAELLGQLKGKLSVHIPEVTEVGPDASYIAAMFLRGEVLNNAAIQAFSSEQLDRFGESIATFIADMNRVVDVDALTELRQKYDPDFEDESAYYRRVYEQGKASGHPLLGRYESYLDHTQHADTDQRIAIHGDLHAGNLVFQQNELYGVIDFADCGPGTIYNELRVLYSLGPEVIHAVAAHLDERFGAIDMTVLHDLAILHELSVLIRSGPELPSTAHRQQIARTLLTNWLGEDWNKKHE